MARYFINGPGLTYTSTSGVAVFVPHGRFLDTAVDPLPGGAAWVPPPDCYNLWAMDAAAQSALQTSINNTKASVSPSGTIVPGLCGGWGPVPIWVP